VDILQLEVVESSLALNQGPGTQVLAVQVQQVEGHERDR
jgi:hypothetical protein